MSATLKTTYSIGDLAEMSSLSRYQISRMLRRENVPVTPMGKRRVVGLDAFRKAFPLLWNDILARADIEEGGL